MLLPKFWRQRQTTGSESERDDDAVNVKRIDYVKLEERRVLNASFAFDLMASDLTLSNFTNDAFAEDFVDIEQVGDDYVFTLNDGFWMGSDTAQVGGNGTNVLTVDINSVDLINIIGNSEDAFDIHFGQMSYLGEMNITTLGGYTEFGLISQQVGTSLSIGSNLLIDGVEVVDLQNAGNDFEVVSISNVISARLSDVNQIALNGTVVDTVLSVDAGEIEVTDTVSADQILAHSDAGLTQTAAGDIAASQLVLTGGGVFDMDNAANEIERLAADIDGDLMLDNSASIEFSALTIDSTEVQGVTISGNFDLTTATVNGDVNQSSKIVVAGNTLIDAGQGHICLDGGDTTGDGVTNNDLYRFSFSAENVGLLDRNGVMLLDSQAGDSVWIATGDADDDLTDNFGGRITLDGNIDVGNSMLLQASSGIIQNSGYLQTPNLLLGGDQLQRSSGTFALTGNNIVSNLAANLVSDLAFSNTVDLNITELSFNADCGPLVSISGISVGGNLIVENSGDVTQAYAVNIAGTSGFLTSGDLCLINPANEFGDQISATADTIEIVAASDLLIGDVIAIDDVFLRSGAVSIGSLTLSGDVIASSATGQVLLQSSNGVVQTGGIILASDLLVGGNQLVEGTGNFVLASDNQVTNLSVAITGDFDFTNQGQTQIASLVYESECGTSESIVGVSIDGNTTLTIDGDLTQTAAVAVTGSSDIAVLGMVCLTNPNNDFVDQVDVSGDSVEIVDSNDLTVGMISAFHQIYLRSGAADMGELTLDGALTTDSAAGQILLQSSNGVIQESGIVSTVELLLGGGDVNESTGPFDLQAENEVQLVAFDVVGDVNFTAVTQFQIAAATFESLCSVGLVESIDQSTVSERAKISSDQTIYVDASISSLTLVLNAGEGIIQDSLAEISSDQLVLTGDGIFDFGTASNEIRELAASIEGSLLLNDTDGLSIATISCGNELVVNGVNVSDDVVIVTTGDLVQQSTAPIIVGGITTLDTLGIGDVCLIGADLNDDGLNDNDLTSLQISYALNAEIADANDLELHGAVVDGQLKLVAGDSVDGQLVLNGNLIGGTATLLQANSGVSQIDGTITVPDLLLVGSDTGDFDLQLANDVDRLAADVHGNLWFTNVVDLIIDELSFEPLCEFVNVSIDGVATAGSDAVFNVGGALSIDGPLSVGTGSAFLNVSGDLDQSSEGIVIAGGLGLNVGGNVVLTANNLIDVLAGDVGGAMLLNNGLDLVVDTVVSGQESEFVASGLSSVGNAKLIVAGNLDINESVNVPAADLFLTVGGDLSQSVSGTIDAGGLGMMVEGQTTLGAANTSNVVAANNGGFTLINVEGDVEIGSVNVEDMQAVGLTTEDSDAKVVVDGNLQLVNSINLGAGNALIMATGNLGQDPTGTITANGLGLMVGGQTVLEAENQVDVFAANNVGFTLIHVVNSVLVDSVNTEGMEVVGLTTQDSDAKLVIGGDLLLNQLVDVGVGNLLLDVAAELTQSEYGTLSAEGLGLMVDGAAVLNAANDLSVVAADVNGFTLINVVGDLAVNSVTVDEMTVDGLTTDSADAKLTVGGKLAIESAVDVGSANLLISTGDDLSQTDEGTIVAYGLGLMVAADVELPALNQISVLAAEVSSKTIIRNDGDLNTGTVIVAEGTEFEMQVDGLDSGSDIKLIVTNDLYLAAPVISAETVFLAVGGNVSQGVNGFILSPRLGLMVTGDTLLASTNDVDTLAAENGGVVYFNDVDDLAVSTVTAFADTAFEMTATGIVTVDSDVKLQIVGDLTLLEQMNTGSGNTLLDVGGDLRQSDSGTIATNELGLIVDGTTVLMLNNDAVVFSAQTNGYIVYNEINDLIVDSATVFSGSAEEMSVAGITASDADVKLVVGGNLDLNSSVNVGDADVGLVAGNDLNQSMGSSIFSDGLSLMVAGSSFLNFNNDVHVISALNGGFTRFGDIDNVIVGAVSVLEGTEFEMQTVGVITADSDFKIAADGDLMIAEPVSIGNGVFFVFATGAVNQSTNGVITAGQLGLMVAGDVHLDAANDVDRLAADNSGLTLFRDIDDLTISTVIIEAGTEFEMSATGLMTGPGSAKLIVSNDLAIEESVVAQDGIFFVDVGGNLSQSDQGKLDVQAFGMMVDGSTNLLADNRVSIVASDNSGTTKFRNVDDLTIGRVELDSMVIESLVVDSHLSMQVVGDLLQYHRIMVQGHSVFDVDGRVCLTGNDFGFGSNANDFVGSLTVTASSSVEIEDTNALTVADIVAGDQIRLRSGDGGMASMFLQGKLETLAEEGMVFLQSNNGVFQDAGSGAILTHDLILGSRTSFDIRLGDFILRGANSVTNISADLENDLEFRNVGDLNIAPLQFISACDGFTNSVDGLDVGSATFIVAGNLTDSADAVSIIRTFANWIVDSDIELGDGDARLEFAGHSIDNLIGQNATANRLTIGTAQWQAQNVSLFVDSTVVLGDVFVSDLLFIDTMEADSMFGSDGDILQSMLSHSESSQIRASDAAFVSRASVQLVNTYFDQLAVESHSVSRLIDPFVVNAAIGSTFTGSIDSNVFNNEMAQTLLLGGDAGVPLNGVTDVDQEFFESGFVANNNQFVNPLRVGAITVNGQTLDVVAFDSLGLSAVQLENVLNPAAAATSLGDIYVETRVDYDLNVMADVDTLSRLSNTTIIAGSDLTLADGAQFRRLDLGELIGLVNRLQIDFSLDGFIDVDPRSVIDVPGDAAFSDLNAQLDNSVGYQDFDFFYGNPGERSFNLIIGWFVDYVSPSQAINAEFQRSLVQSMSDVTGEFLLSDFSNFGQGVSAYTIEFDSQLPGSMNPLGLTNGAQFDRLFFGDRSYLLSQIFLTNDAKINLFENAGTTDLNFTQEVLPTRTVVENPDPIMVATPEFEVPESVGALPQATNVFVNFIQDAESPPITTEQQPESYFLIRYTADDDGVFEESFKWDDANDDPDAIRSSIEGAQLIDGEDDFWPETSGDDEGGWFDKIKNENQVKPGLYFIFEVQEGQLIPEPVDAPVDRTDIENLVEPDTKEPEPDVSLWHSGDTLQSNSDVEPLPPTFEAIEFTDDIASEAPIESGRGKFSAATQKAMLGSSLLLAQTLIRKTSQDQAVQDSHSIKPISETSIFSRASQLLRRQDRESS